MCISILQNIAMPPQSDAELMQLLQIQPVGDINKHIRKRSANEPDEGGAAKRTDEKVRMSFFCSYA